MQNTPSTPLIGCLLCSKVNVWAVKSKRVVPDLPNTKEMDLRGSQPPKRAGGMSLVYITVSICQAFSAEVSKIRCSSLPLAPLIVQLYVACMYIEWSSTLPHKGAEGTATATLSFYTVIGDPDFITGTNTGYFLN